MQYLFKSIKFKDNDKAKEILQKGQAIQVVKHSVELGDYRKGDVLKTPWNELVVVSSVKTYDNLSSKKTVYTNDLYEKYGNIDILDIIKICCLVYFVPVSYYDRTIKTKDHYGEVGIIYNGTVYYCNGINDQSITSFVDRELEFIQRKALFIHSSINKSALIAQYYIGPPAIEYVLRSTGYVIRPNSKDTGSISGDRYFKTITELYKFFKRNRRI